MALLFFAMLAISHGGYTSFSVAAIAALYQVPLAQANLPLTLYLAPARSGCSRAAGSPIGRRSITTWWRQLHPGRAGLGR